MSEEKPAEPIFKTAAEIYDVGRDQAAAQPGLSVSPGLKPVGDSKVPGADRSHVIGPQQSAADPVLAGLDTQHNPMTRAEYRVITRADGEAVVPPPDAASDAMVGPSGVSAPAAPDAKAEAATVTPTADPPAREPIKSASPASAPVKVEPAGVKVEPAPAKG